jgi:tRNA A37 threonylcarbamoyladenosine dehydratase
MDESYTQRFGGIGRLYGAAELPRLEKAHVAVVGVGGVGSWVVEALARSGVGALTLIDMDDVCITNTNRQLPALTHTIGLSKVDVLATRVTEINPACRVNRFIEFLTESNVDRLLTPDFDFVVDAVDRTSIKALIIAKCHARGLSVITSGSAGGRRDPTVIKIADLGHAGSDPLLKGVRQCLRRDHGFAKSEEGRPVTMNVACVYSTERPVYPWADGSCSLEPEKGAETGLRLDCAAGFGAATFVTGTFGFMLAAEVVKKLANSTDL